MKPKPVDQDTGLAFLGKALVLAKKPYHLMWLTALKGQPTMCDQKACWESSVDKPVWLMWLKKKYKKVIKIKQNKCIEMYGSFEKNNNFINYVHVKECKISTGQQSLIVAE
ncbi:MAG: hypothetical protein AAGI66_07835 [Cyanobacteria bacterium P01_H01_bin.74]